MYELWHDTLEPKLNPLVASVSLLRWGPVGPAGLEPALF